MAGVLSYALTDPDFAFRVWGPEGVVYDDHSGTVVAVTEDVLDVLSILQSLGRLSLEEMVICLAGHFEDVVDAEAVKSFMAPLIDLDLVRITPN